MFKDPSVQILDYPFPLERIGISKALSLEFLLLGLGRNRQSIGSHENKKKKHVVGFALSSLEGKANVNKY